MSDSLKEQIIHPNPQQDALAPAVTRPVPPNTTAPDRLPGKPVTLMVSGAPSKLDPATVLQPDTIEHIKEVIARYPVSRSALLPALHIAQEEKGWLPPAYLAAVATLVGISASEAEEVASFYNMFYLKPIGKNIVKVCTSISCYLCGSDAALARLERELSVKRGETSADGNITLIAAECLAACGDAPVAQLNDEFVGKLTEDTLVGLVGKLKAANELGSKGIQMQPADSKTDKRTVWLEGDIFGNYRHDWLGSRAYAIRPHVKVHDYSKHCCASPGRVPPAPTSSNPFLR